jgi:hypothetical protein
MGTPNAPTRSPGTALTASRLFIFVVAVIACLASNRPVFFVLGALLCGAFALSEFAFRRWEAAAVMKCCCFALLFVPAFLKPGMGFSPVFYVFSTAATLLAAMALAQYPAAVLARAFRWVYVACVSAISVGLLMHAGEPEPLGRLLPGASVNGIPSYLLVLQVGVSLSFFACHGRLPLLSPWITGWVAFLGIGRGSLIVAGLIICATLAINLRGRTSRRYHQLLRMLLAMAILILAAIVGPEAYDWISARTKLSAGLMDTHRTDILHAYWHKLGMVSWFLGTDFSGTIIDKLYNGNPHIAFLRTHAFFGLPLTLFALLSPLFAWFSQISRSQKWVYTCFCGLLVVRAMTEPILFPTLLDLIYFTVLFLPFRRDTISPPGVAGTGRPPVPEHPFPLPSDERVTPSIHPLR